MVRISCTAVRFINYVADVLPLVFAGAGLVVDNLGV